MTIKFRVILVLSLLLNIFLFGAGAGFVYKHYSQKPWMKERGTLSPETRNIVGRTLQSTFRDIRPLGQDARTARAELIKVLSAEEFDAVAYDKAVERLRDIKGDIQDKKIAATKEIAQNLPFKERQKMADRMVGMVGGGHEKRVKRHRGPRKYEVLD